MKIITAKDASIVGMALSYPENLKKKDLEGLDKNLRSLVERMIKEPNKKIRKLIYKQAVKK